MSALHHNMLVNMMWRKQWHGPLDLTQIHQNGLIHECVIGTAPSRPTAIEYTTISVKCFGPAIYRLVVYKPSSASFFTRGDYTSRGWMFVSRCQDGKSETTYLTRKGGRGSLGFQSEESRMEEKTMNTSSRSWVWMSRRPSIPMKYVLELLKGMVLCPAATMPWCWMTGLSECIGYLQTSPGIAQ